METALPSTRRLGLSAAAFRRLALANAAMLVVIVATGATVRLTASGLGCEHWPGCEPGHFRPEKDYHSYVEFSNRIVAAVTILVTLVTFVASLLVPRLSGRLRWLALGTFVGTFLQAPLGAITVYYHLNPWLVLTHFLLSLVVLTLGVVLAISTRAERGETVPLRIRRLALVVAAACAVLVVTGTLATAAGPHPGSLAVRRLGSFQPAVWLHVRATAVFGLSFAVLLVWLWRRRSAYLGGAVVLLAVLAAQMTVGEIQYRTRLPWWLVLVHVTLAATVWAVTAALVARLWRASRMS
jgi:cytochrome c oxidase assembly protein subunit 15